MCASNLETDDGSATNDIAEMIDASGAKGVRFVVETGGARAWHNNIVDGSHLDRFLIEDGKIARVASAPLANMGKSDTLADFLMWGTTNYPARRMGGMSTTSSPMYMHSDAFRPCSARSVSQPESLSRQPS